MASEVTLADGRTITGWRAWILLMLLAPVWVPFLMFGALLFVLRRITGRDRLLGFHYVGEGTWRRE